MDFAPKSKVEEGAAVKLGGRFFVIAVSTAFVCDGNEIMGISTQAPIYAEWRASASVTRSRSMERSSSRRSPDSCDTEGRKLLLGITHGDRREPLRSA